MAKTWTHLAIRATLALLFQSLILDVFLNGTSQSSCRHIKEMRLKYSDVR